VITIVPFPSRVGPATTSRVLDRCVAGCGDGPVLERVVELSFSLCRAFLRLLLRGVLDFDQTGGFGDGEGAEFVGL